MNKEEYKDYLKLSGKITEKLDNTATYENWLIIQEYIDRAQQKVEQLENIRKEIKKEIKKYAYTDNFGDTVVLAKYIEDILNKGGNNE